MFSLLLVPPYYISQLECNWWGVITFSSFGNSHSQPTDQSKGKAKGHPLVGWLHHLLSNGSTACKYNSIMQVMQILTFTHMLTSLIYIFLLY